MRERRFPQGGGGWMLARHVRLCASAGRLVRRPVGIDGHRIDGRSVTRHAPDGRGRSGLHGRVAHRVGTRSVRVRGRMVENFLGIFQKMS